MKKVEDLEKTLWAEYYRLKQLSYDELRLLREMLVAFRKPLLVRLVDMAVSSKSSERDNYKKMIV